jgi:hypothetical protein
VKTRLRHAAWKAALWLGWVTLAIPLALAGSWLERTLEGLYGKVRRWAYQEEYRPRKSVPLDYWGPE